MFVKFAAIGAASLFPLGLAAVPAQASPPVTTIVGTLGDDVLTAANSHRPALVFGLPGDDRLTGGPKSDTLLGGLGSDRIRAVGGGSDILRGGIGDGRDVCVGDSSDQFIRCEVVRIR